MVAGIYERIQQRELRSNEDHVTYVSRVEQSILGLKTVSNIHFCVRVFPLSSFQGAVCTCLLSLLSLVSCIISPQSVPCTTCHPHLFNLPSLDPRCASQTSGVLLSSVWGAWCQQASQTETVPVAERGLPLQWPATGKESPLKWLPLTHCNDLSKRVSHIFKPVQNRLT